jgi:hypothetical protein
VLYTLDTSASSKNFINCLHTYLQTK